MMTKWTRQRRRVLEGEGGVEGGGGEGGVEGGEEGRTGTMEVLSL